MTTNISPLNWRSRDTEYVLEGVPAAREIGRGTISAMSADDVLNESTEASYVFHAYGHLMSECERLAFRHIGATMKATLGLSDEIDQREVESSASHLKKLLSEDPQVLDLTRDGYDAFVLRTGQRILRQHRNEIFLNYCPQCGKLARTPKARQCRFCGQDWHDSGAMRSRT